MPKWAPQLNTDINANELFKKLSLGRVQVEGCLLLYLCFKIPLPSDESFGIRDELSIGRPILDGNKVLYNVLIKINFYVTRSCFQCKLCLFQESNSTSTVGLC